MVQAVNPQAVDVESTLSASEDRHARFRSLFDREFNYVWTSLRRLGVSDADGEDLANEVFFRVFERLDEYDPARPIKPWLFAFCARVASDWRRQARHRREVVGVNDEAAPSAEPGADERLRLVERQALLDEALSCLDDDKRAVLVLHDLDEVPIPAIAQALGVPVSTAYSRLRLARGELTAAVWRILRRRCP
jgi:RNA polymerase sigma-70 factor (ECF subfamily)